MLSPSCAVEGGHQLEVHSEGCPRQNSPEVHHSELAPVLRQLFKTLPCPEMAAPTPWLPLRGQLGSYLELARRWTQQMACSRVAVHMLNCPLAVTLVLVPELIICLHDCDASKRCDASLTNVSVFRSSCIPRLRTCSQNLRVETETLFQFMLLFLTYSSFFFFLEKQLTSIQTNNTATQMFFTMVKVGEQLMKKTMAKAKN